MRNPPRPAELPSAGRRRSSVRRVLVASGPLVLAALTVAGCGEDGPDAPVGSEAPSTAPTTSPTSVAGDDPGGPVDSIDTGSNAENPDEGTVP